MLTRFAIGYMIPHGWYCRDLEEGRGRPGAYTFGYYPTLSEAKHVAAWMNDREAGYASLKRFEGGANWPASGGRTEPFEIDSGLAPRNGGRW